MNYGFHRVIKPKGVVPQAADIVDSEPVIKDPYEMILSVDTLNLDASSMNQIREKYPQTIEGRIKEIVQMRGKMHNPDTNSGGVLIGRVKEMGEGLQKKYDLKTDEIIVPLTSLTAIPLYIENISGVRGDHVYVHGSAVLFDCYPYSRIPKDMKPNMALSALDISSIVPQIFRSVKDNDRVLVMGCGKAGMTAMSAAKKVAPDCHIIGMDKSFDQIKIAEELGYAEHLLKMDATQQENVFRNIQAYTKGEFCDLVINCTTATNAETSAILAAKEHGTIYFFSMTTQFDKAALGTDATGKDVTMIIGNGVAEGQAEETFKLLRGDRKLRAIFERLYSE
jgi:L-erythro-3,5-diaminohexanoate dehydrogenase